MDDPYYASTTLLLPGSGANNGTTWPDFSARRLSLLRNGNVRTVTAQSRYYGSSIYFPGGADYLTSYDIQDFDFGTADFCIECWLRLNDVTAAWPAVLASNNASWSTGARAIALLGGGASSANLRKIQMSVNDYVGVFLQSTTQLTLGAWHHVAFSRHGNLFRVFIDGVQEGAREWGGTMNFGYDGAVNIGWARWDGAAGRLHAWLNDLRITRGAARYTANFAPPDKLTGTISGTIADEAGAPAVRKVVAVPRAAPVRTFSADSAADGSYSVAVPMMECSRIVLAQDAGTPGPTDPVLPDLIDRVIPG